MSNYDYSRVNRTDLPLSMSRLHAFVDQSAQSSLLNAILTICISSLIVLISCLVAYVLQHGFKRLFTNVPSPGMTCIDKHAWLHDSMRHEMRYISRADHAYRMPTIQRSSRKSRVRRMPSSDARLEHFNLNNY